MFPSNRSPVFWIILGTLWSATVLVMACENDFAFRLAYVFIGVLAISSYATATFLILKWKSAKRKRRKNSS